MYAISLNKFKSNNCVNVVTVQVYIQLTEGLKCITSLSVSGHNW